MSSAAKSGIKTTQDGSSVIPASERPDGTLRKEIKVRPGYQPPEDVETYKNRRAENWKNRGSGGVPGAEAKTQANEVESKSKNAKRREAAKKKAAVGGIEESALTVAMSKTVVDTEEKDEGAEVVEQQKKQRNALKKLKAVQELKQKKAEGEKLSHDQLMKISKESELLRDLDKLGYDGPEVASKESSEKELAKIQPNGG